jgi:hypothetical protein
LAKHRAERPKIQQQFADLKRGLSSVTDEEWENIPEVGNLTRKKRRKVERSFAVPDSVLVGDRSKNEYENSLDDRQQQVRISRPHFLGGLTFLVKQSGGFETPADSGALTNFVEIGQARDKILSLKLDQVNHSSLLISLADEADTDFWDGHFGHKHFCGSERLSHFTKQCHPQIRCRNWGYKTCPDVVRLPCEVESEALSRVDCSGMLRGTCWQDGCGKKNHKGRVRAMPEKRRRLVGGS